MARNVAPTDHRRATIAQGTCLLRITIDAWGPIATGGFPPRLADR